MSQINIFVQDGDSVNGYVDTKANKKFYNIMDTIFNKYKYDSYYVYFSTVVRAEANIDTFQLIKKMQETSNTLVIMMVLHHPELSTSFTKKFNFDNITADYLVVPY